MQKKVKKLLKKRKEKFNFTPDIYPEMDGLFLWEKTVNRTIY